MAYKAKAYTLREESTESGIRYFISFKDGQGEHHELEVSEQLFFEFRQMERRNRNLLQWDERHREFSEVWDETLNRRACARRSLWTPLWQVLRPAILRLAASDKRTAA